MNNMMQFWNRTSYWFRGGLTALIVSVTLSSILLPLLVWNEFRFDIKSPLGLVIVLLGSILSIPLQLIPSPVIEYLPQKLIGDSLPTQSILGSAILLGTFAILAWFACGSVIGFLYGRNKNKKNATN